MIAQNQKHPIMASTEAACILKLSFTFSGNFGGSFVHVDFSELAYLVPCPPSSD